jgi:putative nucleotidyltransferase with HDIG domain
LSQNRKKLIPLVFLTLKLKNTEEFIRFKQHIEDNAEKLEESFRLLANDSIPLDVDKLTEPVYHLVVEAGGTAGVFDMLHNLRDSSDEVYMHSLNVSLISNTLATWMRLPNNKIQLATAAGLLHDIGKVLMPPELLGKNKQLTDYEQRIMNEHVIKGYELVKTRTLIPTLKIPSLCIMREGMAQASRSILKMIR